MTKKNISLFPDKAGNVKQVKFNGNDLTVVTLKVKDLNTILRFTKDTTMSELDQLIGIIILGVKEITESNRSDFEEADANQFTAIADLATSVMEFNNLGDATKVTPVKKS